MDMTTEIMTAIDAMGPGAVENLAAGIGVIFVAVIAAIVYAVIRYLMTAIGYSKMYRKAGVSGFKAFIPVYNTYNNYKISMNGRLFFLYAALVIVSTILGVYTEGVMALLAGAVSLGIIILAVKQNLNMAKRFGKGAGTGILLILFPGITSLVLGLGKAEFHGEIIENN